MDIETKLATVVLSLILGLGACAPETGETRVEAQPAAGAGPAKTPEPESEAGEVEAEDPEGEEDETAEEDLDDKD